jgi:tRNA A37 threonylcarbamoyladenosine dehydratase
MSDLWRQFNASHRAQLIAAAVVSGLTVGTLVVGLQALEREGRLRRLKRSLSADGDEVRLPSLSLLPSLVSRWRLQVHVCVLTLNKLIATSLSRTSGPPSRGGGLTTPPAVATLAADDSDEARVVALARRARAGDFDEDLILEQLARNRVFLTDDGLSRLRDAFVVVVGCGGVGSHCAAALARSGVSRIRLIDFDQVTLSSLNRHAVATLLDVGTPKVKCLERRLAAVAPWVRFDLRGEKFDEHVAESMLGPWAGHDGRLPDFVVDAIDNIDTKVELLRYCHSHSLPIIASMGAGCKSDPTRIVVGDIGTSTYDRLSRATRRRLKLHGIVSGIPAVFSTEEAGEGKAELLPVPEEEFAKGGVDDLGVMPSFRVRILPVLGTMPAVFGYTLANHVILAISGEYFSSSVAVHGLAILHTQT